MTDKGSGGDGPRYTVHARTIKNPVFGDDADQRNQLPAKAKGSAVLVAAAALAVLAAAVVAAVVLLGGSHASVGSAPPAPSGLPGPPPAVSSSAPAPTPSHPAGRSPDAVTSAPRPTVRATRPPASSVPGTAPAAPAPEPSPPCPPRKEYRVTNKAQLKNAAGEHIGDVASGTLFFREESATYPTPVYDRYYGTVDQALSGSATGYVLRKKLDYVGTVAYCGGADG
ncbi:hypothetical protein [Streptomyces sp. NPDC021020]|uniref:hypothetical protein n=1 Tax=Streptomyces sp. NPDC021020 TaxID=3365109 RepID=UPI0037ADC324